MEEEAPSRDKPKVHQAYVSLFLPPWGANPPFERAKLYGRRLHVFDGHKISYVKIPDCRDGMEGCILHVHDRSFAPCRARIVRDDARYLTYVQRGSDSLQTKLHSVTRVWDRVWWCQHGSSWYFGGMQTESSFADDDMESHTDGAWDSDGEDAYAYVHDIATTPFILELPVGQAAVTSSGGQRRVLDTPLFVTAAVGCGRPTVTVCCESGVFVICGLATPPVRDSLAAEGLLRGMQDMRSCRDLSDVTLEAGGRQYELHRMMLAMHSEYFAGLFRSEMSESVTGTVKLDLVRPDALEVVLTYIYGGAGCLTGLSTSRLLEVCELAQRLLVARLFDLCVREMIIRVCDTNVVQILLWTASSGIKPLREFCVRYVAANFTSPPAKEGVAEQLRKALAQDPDLAWDALYL